MTPKELMKEIEEIRANVQTGKIDLRLVNVKLTGDFDQDLIMNLLDYAYEHAKIKFLVLDNMKP